MVLNERHAEKAATGEREAEAAAALQEALDDAQYEAEKAAEAHAAEVSMLRVQLDAARAELDEARTALAGAAANAGDGGVASAELRAENETLREELAAAQKAHAAVAEAMRQSDAVEELRLARERSRHRLAFAAEVASVRQATEAAAKAAHARELELRSVPRDAREPRGAARLRCSTGRGDAHEGRRRAGRRRRRRRRRLSRARRRSVTLSRTSCLPSGARRRRRTGRLCWRCGCRLRRRRATRRPSERRWRASCARRASRRRRRSRR